MLKSKRDRPRIPPMNRRLREALLGHGSSKMVARYAHLRPETLADTADALERAEIVELRQKVERIVERRTSEGQRPDS